MPDPTQGNVQFTVEGAPEHLDGRRRAGYRVKSRQPVEGVFDSVGGLLFLFRPTPPIALATEAGRLAYLAGRIPRKLYGSASSPIAGVIGS